jgi:hypothetical protein
MNNGDWMMAKKAEKVSDWLFRKRSDDTDPQIYQDFADTWGTYPHELRTLVGHCRSKTVGNTDNENNHPFAIQVDEKNAILGVHNGTLDNHETVFERLPGLLERQGTVDSEAIFHYLFYATEHGTQEMNPQIIESLGERIEGAYAVVMANSRFPYQMTAFRQTRPLHIHLISPLNIVLLASDSKYTREALDQYKFIRQTLMPELPELETDDRMLAERDFRIFDTRKEFPSSLTYQSINDISEYGEFRKVAAPILPEWKKEASTTSSSKGSGKNEKTTHTAKISKPATGKKLTAKQSGANDETTVVEVEVLDKDGKPLDMSDEERRENEKAWRDASSIGLTVSYESDRELAKHLGVNEIDLSTMGKLHLASELSKLHFALYYALGRADTAEEIKGIKKGARGQHSRIERAEEKKKLAEGKIWEFKVLAQVLVALHGRHYKMCAHNVKLVLDAYPGIPPKRREDVLRTAENVLDSPDLVEIIARLRPKFDDVELRKAFLKRDPKPDVKLLATGEE